MTTLTWTGSTGNNFENVANWQPALPPVAGDVLVIANGYADVPQNTYLSGMVIDLGGPQIAGNISPAPSGLAIQAGTIDYGNGVTSYNPTLGFEDNVVIDGSTTIQMPATAERGSANAATLWFRGNFVNNGTIGLPFNQSSNPQQMNMITSPDNTGTFTNNGVINIPVDQYTDFAGKPPAPAANGYVSATNNGNINVYGTLEMADVDLHGNGTITVGAISNNLGLPPVVGQFLLDGEIGNPVAGTVAFDGGHLTFNNGDRSSGIKTGVLNFGQHAQDEITINGFYMASESFNNGILSINGGFRGPGDLQDTFQMPFGNLPGSGQFLFTQDGANVDVTWGAATPDPRPVRHPIMPPIHVPPGYHIS